jgi:hypothetical protein
MLVSKIAESIAIKLGKEERADVIQALQSDIIGYRASIISAYDVNSVPELYFQYLSNLTFKSDTDIFNTKYYYLVIPKLIIFKNSNFLIRAYNVVGNKKVSIPILTAEEDEVGHSRVYTSKKPYLVYQNSTLVAKNFNPLLLSGILIGGVFNNPLDVLSYCQVNNFITESSCIVDNELDIEDSLFQKITIFLMKQNVISTEPNLIKTNNE